MLPVEWGSARVVATYAAKALEGNGIMIRVRGGGVVPNDTTKVSATGVAATNGVIHVIDGVLLRPDLR